MHERPEVGTLRKDRTKNSDVRVIECIQVIRSELPRMELLKARAHRDVREDRIDGELLVSTGHARRLRVDAIALAHQEFDHVEVCFRYKPNFLMREPIERGTIRPDDDVNRLAGARHRTLGALRVRTRTGRQRRRRARGGGSPHFLHFRGI